MLQDRHEMVLLVLKLAMLFLVLRSQMTTSPEEEAVARICWNLRFHDRPMITALKSVANV